MVHHSYSLLSSVPSNSAVIPRSPIAYLFLNFLTVFFTKVHFYIYLFFFLFIYFRVTATVSSSFLNYMTFPRAPYPHAAVFRFVLSTYFHHSVGLSNILTPLSVYSALFFYSLKYSHCACFHFCVLIVSRLVSVAWINTDLITTL